MGAVVQLASTSLEVEPGRSATSAITVRNTGSVVDRFSFEAIGAAAPWVTFAPETISLFPEASGTVNILFSPPRSPTVTAGEIPFAVRVSSSEDAAGTVVEEGTLTVAPFSDVSVEMVPRLVTGRRGAITRLAVDNRSNFPYRAQLEGTDQAAALAFAFNPAVVDVPPGEAAFVRVRLRPRHPFWRGPATARPFRTVLKSQVPPGAEPGPHPPELPAEGSLMQQPLLPRWLIGVAAAIVALAALAVILWFTLLKPQIRSTAKHEVQTQLAQAGVAPTGSTASNQPATGSAGGSGSSGAGSGGAGASQSTVAPPIAGSSAGQTVNGSSQAAGNGSQVVYTVPAGHVLQVTDLLIQNAAGDTGTLTMQRDGTVLMQWSLANFRDLDYHWIAPTLFGAGTKMEMVVSGCVNACHPGIYYAGNLVKAS